MSGAPGRWLRPLLLLAFALLCLQQLALTHGYAHELPHAHGTVGHDHDGDDAADAPCVECLALNAVQAPPPPGAASGIPGAAAVAAPAATVPPAPTFRRRAPFLSRAPPPFLA
jgi:hypothetical protein